MSNIKDLLNMLDIDNTESSQYTVSVLDILDGGKGFSGNFMKKLKSRKNFMKKLKLRKNLMNKLKARKNDIQRIISDTIEDTIDTGSEATVELTKRISSGIKSSVPKVAKTVQQRVQDVIPQIEQKMREDDSIVSILPKDILPKKKSETSGLESTEEFQQIFERSTAQRKPQQKKTRMSVFGTQEPLSSSVDSERQQPTRQQPSRQQPSRQQPTRQQPSRQQPLRQQPLRQSESETDEMITDVDVETDSVDQKGGDINIRLNELNRIIELLENKIFI